MYPVYNKKNKKTDMYRVCSKIILQYKKVYEKVLPKENRGDQRITRFFIKECIFAAAYFRTQV
jgi:hypothetical protein